MVLKNRRIFQFCLFSMVLLFSWMLPVRADAGPKPEIIIEVRNAPQEKYYLDLLVQDSATEFRLEDIETMDPVMISALRSLEAEGWYPVLAHGSSRRTMGSLTGNLENGIPVHHFTYSVPSAFRVILVTQSGKIVVSDEIKTQTFTFRIRFDAETGIVTQPGFFEMYTLQLFSTLFPTLIIEGVLLVLFGLFSRKNLKVFLITNLLTQVFLTVLLVLALLNFGVLGVILGTILGEFVIFIIEPLVYLKFMDKQKRWVRVVYGLIANLASFAVSLLYLTNFFG